VNPFAHDPSLFPDDTASLKALLLSLMEMHEQEKQRNDQQAQRAEAQENRAHQQQNRADGLQKKSDELYLENLRLQVQVDRFKRWYYGPRADRLSTALELGQMLLAFGEEFENKPVNKEDLPTGEKPDESPRRILKSSGRRNLDNFDKLPVQEHAYELSEAERACPSCGKQRKEIGADESWQLEYYPGHFERLHHVRKKYACAGCDAEGENPRIESAKKSAAAIDKGLPGPGLLSYITVCKFDMYLPLYRLENHFERQGFRIARSTQSIWCGDVADLVEPLYRRMIKRVLESHLIATDDTHMPMQAKEKAARAYMWVYIGDDENPYNIYDFSTSRDREGPIKFLGDYDQVLLADGYAGYNGVVTGNALRRAGCWLHLKRKFVEAERTAPEIALAVVEEVRALYIVEHAAEALKPAERLALRQERSAPIVASLQNRLQRWKLELIPKHPMADAVNYALNQWQAMTTFLDDAAVPLDNNLSEREMKRVVINRKNSLFVGNERGGRTMAILSSFTSTCRRLGIDPQLYLTQLITNMPILRQNELDSWLPDVWKQRLESAPL
jgi:transposase